MAPFEQLEGSLSLCATSAAPTWGGGPSPAQPGGAGSECHTCGVTVPLRGTGYPAALGVNTNDDK